MAYNAFLLLRYKSIAAPCIQLLLLFHQYVNELFDGLLADATLKTAISNRYTRIHQCKYLVHSR
jgi:hypothetical protein